MRGTSATKVALPPEGLPRDAILFPIFPMWEDLSGCGCGKPTCHSMGKHPPFSFGTLQSSAQIPFGANYAVRTGDFLRLPDGRSGFLVVVDLDRKISKEGEKIDGIQDLLDLARTRGGGAKIPDTLTVMSPSGGLHLYYLSPDPVRGNAGIEAPGIDLRGTGNYVVGPGSVGCKVKNEPKYGLAPYALVGTTHIADLPPWIVSGSSKRAQIPGGAAVGNAPQLVSLLARGGLSAAAPDAPMVPVTWEATETTDEGWNALHRGIARLSEAKDGTRNNTLFSVCVALGDYGQMGVLRIEDARLAVYNAIATWTDPDKCIRTAESAFARAKAKKLVLIRPDHYAVNEEVIPALVADRRVFAIGTRLASERGAVVEPISVNTLRELLSTICSFRIKNKEGELKATHPPDYTVSEIFDRKVWDGVRLVTGFSSVPIMRPDGTILKTAGWDPVTGVYLAETWEEEIPPLKDALEIFRLMASEFPFAERADYAAFVSACVTPLAMYAYKGPTPLHLFEASRKNSGKTFLASAAALIGTGKAVSQEAGWSENDQELAKKLVSWAMSANKPVIFWDNIKGKFSSPLLAGFLTSQDRTISDRILGGNATFTGALNTMMLATGNNPIVGADLERRIVPCRLEPEADDVDEMGFRKERKYVVGDFLRFVRQHSRLLTLCALSILSAPKTGLDVVPWPKRAPASSFEGWSSVVRDRLCDLGLSDCWTGPARLGQEEAEDDLQLVRMIGQVLSTGPKTANQLVELCQLQAPPSDFKAAMSIRFPKGGISSRLIGYLLRDTKGRYYEHQKISTRLVKGLNQWYLAPPE